MGTNVAGLNHVWAQTCLGLIMYGHKRGVPNRTHEVVCLRALLAGSSRGDLCKHFTRPLYLGQWNTFLPPLYIIATNLPTISPFYQPFYQAFYHFTKHLTILPSILPFYHQLTIHFGLSLFSLFTIHFGLSLFL